MNMIDAKKRLKGASKSIEPRILILKRQKERELKKAYNSFYNSKSRSNSNHSKNSKKSKQQSPFQNTPSTQKHQYSNDSSNNFSRIEEQQARLVKRSPHSPAKNSTPS
jgi:hypothetical protein